MCCNSHYKVIFCSELITYLKVDRKDINIFGPEQNLS